MSDASNPTFPSSANIDLWAKAAAKSAPGGNLDGLNWKTPEGLTVKPLYTKKDVEGLPHADTLPGFAPYLNLDVPEKI